MALLWNRLLDMDASRLIYLSGINTILVLGLKLYAKFYFLVLSINHKQICQITKLNILLIVLIPLRIGWMHFACQKMLCIIIKFFKSNSFYVNYLGC